ncbi:acyltransferase family protein [Herbiconiux sp. A18JL235]|uniref:Acyltransferase family protein n=1 Tax=Herbiconiux sp. A18JL235 TaxID=3152363 RepID=A0AB39BHV9_9MICO
MPARPTLAPAPTAPAGAAGAAGAAAAVLPSLTGLRWVTAMLIFGDHVMAVQYFAGGSAELWATFFAPGSAGVAMFFVLSGFVLTWSHKPGQRPGDFWMRRVARVYPTHLVGVALAVVVGATLVPVIATTAVAPFVADIALVSAWNPAWWQAGNPVSWSLVCEAFFYLCFPLLIRVLYRVSVTALVVTVALCSVVTAIAPWIAGAAPDALASYSSPILRLPEFVVGICAALLLRSGAWRPPRPMTAVAFAVAGYLASAAPALPATEVSPGPAFAVLAFTLLIASLAESDRRGLPTGLTTPLWQTFGRASFAFYVVHLLVIGALAAPWPDGHPLLPWPQGALLTTLALAVAVALALLIHRGVELPMQRAILHSYRAKARRSGRPDDAGRRVAASAGERVAG